MPNSHIVSSFGEDIKNLRQKIVEMAKLVQEQFNNAEKALVERDLKLASSVKDRDAIVDQIEQEIEQKAIELIATRSPMADDLREIISAIKICNALERIGDYAKNLSKRVPVINEEKQFVANTTVISQMISIINDMTEDVIDAYNTKDADKAISVWTRDLAVDNLYDSFFRELLTHMMENPRSITSATHLLFIAKNVERAGDHLTNIAEIIYYIIEGRTIEMVRPKGDLSNETSF
ncbi:phosphate signaling complex protein PhoU [Emcibacteraceae bacterium]|jgi:phosphate transport system protein|uniref:phosphate signaling complex protein PhoU n=1 Tax=Pseudemcibacter sp. TaxID=2943293 RepID=UPI00231BD417|nr:phosphate signaling complex protein PhoU [Emcibacteraceae bacterium]MDA9771044.1 phosphate signaling complex protein PhoU [Emcibacteraceae bacterium]MDC1090065.1 phosphate signaling complex protein PhoU [Emcibacteraceae bacterium]